MRLWSWSLLWERERKKAFSLSVLPAETACVLGSFASRIHAKLCEFPFPCVTRFAHVFCDGFCSTRTRVEVFSPALDYRHPDSVMPRIVAFSAKPDYVKRFGVISMVGMFRQIFCAAFACLFFKLWVSLEVFAGVSSGSLFFSAGNSSAQFRAVESSERGFSFVPLRAIDLLPACQTIKERACFLFSRGVSYG